MLLLLRSCAEVRKAIELAFVVVSGVGPGIDVLDGCPRASREWVVLGDFSVFASPMGTLEVNIFSIGRGTRAHADILVISKILSFYSGFIL